VVLLCYSVAGRLFGARFMSVITVDVPNMGDSITEGTLIKFHQEVGDEVSEDDLVAEIDSEKIVSEGMCCALYLFIGYRCVLQVMSVWTTERW
jgi:biotin-dependent enzyme